MRPYADLPDRRARQVLGDLAGIAWCVLVVLGARAVHGSVADLAAPGRELEDAGQGLADGLTNAADRLGGIPFVGDDVAGQVLRAAAAAQGLADAGQAQQDYVARVAVLSGLSVLVAGLAVAAVGWLLPRLRWARRAAQARVALAGPDGADLLALRALTTGPVDELAVLAPGLMDAWRRGDPEVVHLLAGYELARLGLRVPAPLLPAG